MSTLLMLTVAILAVLAIGSWLVWQYIHHRNSSYLAAFNGAKTRKLTDDERQTIENYLARSQSQVIAPTGADSAPVPPVLNSRSNTVISVNRAITRYGLTTDDANKWRYYLDAVEVFLPPFLEQYISNDNAIELIETDTLPLIISLNHHSLFEYEDGSDERALSLDNLPSQASFSGKEGEQIELLHTRRETLEEYHLRRPQGVREALLVSLSFLLFFCSQTGPDFLMPWLIVAGGLVLALGLWGIWGRPGHAMRREIHCLRGTPRRWGLFGENDRDQLNNISLGVIDLTYPPHWQPWLPYELGQSTNIDFYLDHRVTRQGRFLSLQDEVRNFPLQRWMRSLIISLSALIILIMMLFWMPLDIPMKLTLSWLKGSQTIEATSVKELAKAEPQVGDTVKISGTGMCNIPMPGPLGTQKRSPFMPFDCSQIIWNTARPLPLPESDVTNKAQALVDEVALQLHPQNHPDSRVNPQLASAIARSGMVLVDDFSGIVIKTAALCTEKHECVRLKNALVNLGNTKNWDTLVRRARNGRLDGINVILRPVSAESLENLVNTSTAPFFVRETAKAAQKLNSPAPGGFMIGSESDIELVNHPFPAMNLYDYPPQQQWQEFRRLASMLMNTSFHAEGIITQIQVDANGTQHITLNTLPGSISLGRLLGTCLLLLAMLACFVVNAILAVRRYQRHNLRMDAIKNYYHQRFNPPLLPPADEAHS
ncbi:putative membrane protein IgaA [Salmonella enterica subsp. enterica serovar Choleraesuis]|nr:putative membrane protein IgaA [Salmonella enterica subsp. enterica serovar Choleraesuis]